jgi:NAD-dependent DNA ligase
VPSIVVLKKNCLERILQIARWKWIQEKWEIDGIVIKSPNTENRQAHYRINAIAWKFQEEIAKTTVREIHWKVGRSGQLTPNISIKEVILHGRKIRNLSAHNKDFIVKNKLGPGSEISIRYSGATIPTIAKIIRGTEDLQLPRTCPSCQSVLKETSKHFICDQDDCLWKKKSYLDFIFSRSCINLPYTHKGVKMHLWEGKRYIWSTIGFLFESGIKLSNWQALVILNIPGLSVRIARLLSKQMDLDYLSRRKLHPKSRALQLAIFHYLVRE